MIIYITHVTPPNLALELDRYIVIWWCGVIGVYEEEGLLVGVQSSTTTPVKLLLECRSIPLRQGLRYQRSSSESVYR